MTGIFAFSHAVQWHPCFRAMCCDLQDCIRQWKEQVGVAVTSNDNISHTTIYNWLLFWVAWGVWVLFVTAKHCIHSQQWRGQAVCAVHCMSSGHSKAQSHKSDCTPVPGLLLMRWLWQCICLPLAHRIVPKVLKNISGCKQSLLNSLRLA